LPPSCNATECSAVSKSRWRGTSPCSNAPVVIISVYRRALGASKRWKYRQCRSVTSIMGATHRRQPDGSGVDFETANVWDRGGVLMKIRRKRQYNRSFSHGSAGWTKIQRLPQAEASPGQASARTDSTIPAASAREKELHASMAVFTPVSDDDARALLQHYSLGELVSLRGIT